MSEVERKAGSMARVVPIVARTIRENGRVFQRGRAVEIEDEGLYHHLLRTGRFKNPDQLLRTIPPAQIARLRAGSVVTVLREVGLGDVLMVLVVIRALKERFRELHFRLATGRQFLPLLEGLDFLAGAESLMDLRGSRGDVLDLRGLPERHPDRERLDRIDVFARHCGIQVRDYSVPVAAVSVVERARAEEVLGHGPTIALAVRGSTHVRTWPAESVRAFAELAAGRGWTVAVLDHAPFDLPSHPRIRNLAGQLSISDVKAVIAASDFCVSPDSGLQHLAEAVGTRCLAIYSTTPPALRIGHYAHVKAIWRESLPCVPCFDRGCPLAPCMKVPAEVVLTAIENWERLGLATNVDADVHALRPAIRVEREAHIMGAWPAA